MFISINLHRIFETRFKAKIYFRKPQFLIENYLKQPKSSSIISIEMCGADVAHSRSASPLRLAIRTQQKETHNRNDLTAHDALHSFLIIYSILFSLFNWLTLIQNQYKNQYGYRINLIPVASLACASNFRVCCYWSLDL